MCPASVRPVHCKHTIKERSESTLPDGATLKVKEESQFARNQRKMRWDEMSKSQMTNHYMSVCLSLWVCESVCRLCTSASVCEQHKKKKESVQQRSKSSCAVSACGCLSKKPGRSTLCDSPRDQPPSTVASFKSFSNTNCIWRKINKHFYQDIQWILNGRY